MSAVAGRAVKVQYRIANGMAMAGSDNVSKNETLNFASGESSKDSIPICDVALLRVGCHSG